MCSDICILVCLQKLLCRPEVDAFLNHSLTKFLRLDLSVNLELTNSTRRAGQQVLEILPLPLSDVTAGLPAILSVFMWVLKMKFISSCLYILLHLS